jgi:hypothetical protein
MPRRGVQTRRYPGRYIPTPNIVKKPKEIIEEPVLEKKVLKRKSANEKEQVGEDIKKIRSSL